MTKKDITNVLKAIKKHCYTRDFCSSCVFVPWCFGSPSEMSKKEIKGMASEIKEVMKK